MTPLEGLAVFVIFALGAFCGMLLLALAGANQRRGPTFDPEKMLAFAKEEVHANPDLYQALGDVGELDEHELAQHDIDIIMSSPPVQRITGDDVLEAAFTALEQHRVLFDEPPLELVLNQEAWDALAAMSSVPGRVYTRLQGVRLGLNPGQDAHVSVRGVNHP